ncbi:MAG: nitronate monooxygenase, partial [Psychrobacter sp.]|nr:nitronate monooxygenase [Psychrobacter sp.]
MTTAAPLLQQLGITCPIVQAPMAGGATTPELIAAVSNFGGLGSLGAGMTDPMTISQQIDSIKTLTSKPFAVNLMVLTEQESTLFDAPMPEWLADYYADHDISVDLPDYPAQNFEAQLAVLLDNPVPVASFTFGIISSEQVEALHQVGTKVIGTANHPLEAKAWADIGADAVCVQGLEAGGHRGGWLAISETDPLGLLTLITQTRALTDIPLIAAGGLMTGRDIRAVQIAGAEMAQLGTAFLTTHESGIHPIYKDRLLEVGSGKRPAITRLTRLFSGKLARGLLNEYLTTYAEFDLSPAVLKTKMSVASLANKRNKIMSLLLPPYPQLNAMTRQMRATAARDGDAEYMSLWAGQGVALVRS